LVCVNGREARVRQALHGPDIEHRLTPPKSPQTNSIVERFNGRIEDVLQSHHFQSGEELGATLHR
jgi:transposase InsO family protein